MSSTLGGVGLGLLTKLVTSGLQRAGSLIFQKMIRITRIENALRVGYIRNETIKKAIDDFETVIGTRYGQLTEELDQFLQELERSGIINSMVENALIGRSSTPTKEAFKTLHSQAFDGKQNPEHLYIQLETSFSITLRELSKDRVLLDAIRLVSQDISGRLDAVDRALSEIKIPKKNTPEPLALEVLKPNLLKIAKGLQSAYKQIRIETNKGVRLVDISKIYIPPKLRYRDTKRNADLIANATRILSNDPRLSRSTDGGIAWGNASEQIQIISYGDLKLTFSRIAILGDPGGGKSTICQNICLDLAKQAAGALLSSSKPSAQLQKFPFRVILRNYEKARAIHPQLSIFEFIVRDLGNHVALPENEIRECLRYLLNSGAAVIAFDGLDEILATAQRREFVELVASFCDQHPLCPALVTSRLVGYDDARLPDEFEELILARFDQEEILKYASKFFQIVAGRDARESEKLARKFVNQTSANAADLRTNPLMLGLMTWLFHVRGDVPTNRPEIYSECATLMFERWDPDRGIKPDLPVYFDKLQLFTQLASEIFGQPELSAGVEKVWLENEVRHHLESIYDNKARATSGAKNLVEFITGRAWVMTDVGDRIYAFTHQTFLEYFFARHINENADTVDQILELIIPRILNKEWEVVSHLSLQMKTHRSFRRENEALDGLLALLQGQNRNEPAALAFASRSLEYLVGSEVNVRPLVTTIIANSLQNGNRDHAAQVIQQILQASNERREYVSELAYEQLVSAFKSNEDDVIIRMISSIASQNSERHLRNSGQLPQAMAKRIKAALKNFITERAEQNARFASLAWSWYGVVTKTTLQKFGLSNFYFAEIDDGINGIDGLSGLVLAASETFRRHYDETPFNKKRAREILALIGQVGLRALSIQDANPVMVGGLGGPPIKIWQKLLENQSKSPNVLAGALITFLVVTVDSPEDGNLTRLDVANKFIRRNSKHPIFQQIDVALKDGFFEEHSFKRLSPANDLPV